MTVLFKGLYKSRRTVEIRTFYYETSTKWQLIEILELVLKATIL